MNKKKNQSAKHILTSSTSVTPEKSTEKQPDKLRRRALLGAATGASLVAWHKPIVSSMVLPAHAQTSGPVDPPPPPPVASAFFGANVTPGPLTKVGDSILDFFVPEAIAGAELQASQYSISVVPVGTDNENFTISLFEDFGAIQGFDVAQVVYSGQVSVTSGGSLSPADNPCSLEGLADIEVEIADLGADAVVLNLTSRSQSVTVPAGDGALPMAMCTDGTPALNFQIQNFNAGQMETKNSNSLLDLLVPAANAGLRPQPIEERVYTINARETAPSSGSFEITLLERIANPFSSQTYSVLESTFSGTLAGPGSGTLTLLAAGCDEAETASLSVTIDSVNESALDLSIDSRELAVTLMPGSVMIGAPMCEAILTAQDYFQPGGGGLQQQPFGATSPTKSLLDLIIPEAFAGRVAPSPAEFGLSASKLNDQEFAVEMLNPSGDLLRAGTLNINGSTGSLMPQMSPCFQEGMPTSVPARILFIDENEVVVELTRNSQGGTITLVVPAGTGVLSELCIE